MLKVINKDGKQIMEIRDNGDMVIREAKLREALKPSGQVIEEDKKEDEE